jgi:CPA2 family monovalent cation:H+ antiporter-2
VTFVFRLIKQPVVLGYIVAGVIVGPYTPKVFSVVDEGSVKVWAELGVIFLMFALGLEFSFRRLAKVGASASITATFQIIVMIFIGYLTGRLLDWTPLNSIFLGCMISISSTTIIIKAFEELGLKTRRFAELVFGILIVEDLAAIVMLVALGSLATKATLSGLDLLITGFRLSFIVGLWLVVGMLLVPRLVREIGRRGNDEMLVVVSLGLCLALVATSAYFNYSVALGAFVMGSILAETKEAHRIEKLVTPLKDLFGAIFFVSVGMLLNPTVLIHNIGSVFVISAVIIVGNTIAVSTGALMTGQTLRTSVQTGFSMAQIGEFSFIIATLGASYGVLDAAVYPVIVAAAVITTFTTPYMVKVAPRAVTFLELRLPEPARATIDRYGNWFQRQVHAIKPSQDFYIRAMRWLANAIVMITLFVVSASYLVPALIKYGADYFPSESYAQATAWIATFVLASPCLWAMLWAFRPMPGLLLITRLVTVFLLGLVSAEFFAVWIAVAMTSGIAALLFVFFRRQIESYYRWFEDRFVDGIETPEHEAENLDRFAPWDAHLAEVVLHPDSTFVGKTLKDLELRERYGLSVIVIRRDPANVVAPKASERIYPGDELLCFGTDAALERFRIDVDASRKPTETSGVGAYALKPLAITADSEIVGRTIKDSRIAEEFGCMVVGLERSGKRHVSPKSETRFEPEDTLWVVGDVAGLDELKRKLNPAAPVSAVSRLSRH